MQKNELLKYDDSIIRILEIKADSALVVDCIRKSMPKWVQQSEIFCYENCNEQELVSATGKMICEYDSLDKKSRRFVHNQTRLAD